MRFIRPVPLILAALVLAACSSTSTSTSTDAAAPAPSPVSTAGLTCDDSDLAAAHIVTDVHYASLNVGTTNDTQPTFADLAQNLAVVQAMAPQCAADATDALAAFAEAADAAAAAYQPGGDAAVITADKAALEELKTTGVAAWKAMGMDASTWDTALRFTS